VTGQPLRGAEPSGLLGDTACRDYSSKLRAFNAFAEPELRHAMGALNLAPGMRVLDVGCGTGEALSWLYELVEPDGAVVGVDISAAHLETASRRLRPGLTIVQADLMQVPFPAQSFDLIWCVNTIHHLRDPLQGVMRLASLLRPGGRIALGQSSFLPDMYFAWDARLERLTNEAVRSYYRERYGLDETDLTAVRALLGLLHRASLRHVSVRTIVIERTAPLGLTDRAYLREAIFRQTWGERLRPYLSPADYAELSALCDPEHPLFALRRADFHFLQTFTLGIAEIQRVTGEV
jgi:ubiquinone/menaquinone biosynthesis C-methylase UbiE